MLQNDCYRIKFEQHVIRTRDTTLCVKCADPNISQCRAREQRIDVHFELNCSSVRVVRTHRKGLPRFTPSNSSCLADPWVRTLAVDQRRPVVCVAPVQAEQAERAAERFRVEVALAVSAAAYMQDEHVRLPSHGETLTSTFDH